MHRDESVLRLENLTVDPRRMCFRLTCGLKRLGLYEAGDRGTVSRGLRTIVDAIVLDGWHINIAA
jgi:hypothetical protein